MTPNDIIVDAKRLAQDNDLFRTPDSYSAATLLGFVQQVLKQTVVIRPDLFTLMTDITPQAETAEQVLPADSMRLVSILAVKNGNAITEVSREMMDRSYPQWRTDPAGAPVNYMRHIVNPNRYFLYPSPIAGTVLTGEYVQTPPTYTLNQSIALLPDGFQSTMVSGVVMMIAAVENDSNDTVASGASRPNYVGRFKQFQEIFLQSLGANLQGRNITDTRTSGLEPKEVI